MIPRDLQRNMKLIRHNNKMIRHWIHMMHIRLKYLVSHINKNVIINLIFIFSIFCGVSQNWRLTFRGLACVAKKTSCVVSAKIKVFREEKSFGNEKPAMRRDRCYRSLWHTSWANKLHQFRYAINSAGNKNQFPICSCYLL